MFKLVNTFKNAASPQNQQRGMPAPGTGAQRTNPPRRKPGETPWVARIPYEGTDTWEGQGETYGTPSFPVDAQRGAPAPQSANQRYPAGALTTPALDGKQYYRVTRQFSRGAQRMAPITGIVLSSPNPGDFVPHKPNVVPRYPLGQYINNTIFWTNQVIPTTVKLSGLQTEEALDAMLSNFVVYGKAQGV